MRIATISMLSLFLWQAPAFSATITSNCTATVQSIGACGAGDAGEAGVLIAYWASSIDDAPADSEVGSNAVDLRDAICAHFGIVSANCTKETADGAVRKLLENIVKAYRQNKKTLAIAAPVAPVLDVQANP